MRKLLNFLTHHYNCTLAYQTYTQDTYYMDAVTDINSADLLDLILGHYCSLPSSRINSKLIIYFFLKKRIHKHFEINSKKSKNCIIH